MSTELEKASDAGRALAEAVDEGRVSMSKLLNAIGINANDPVHQAALLACERAGQTPRLNRRHRPPCSAA